MQKEAFFANKQTLTMWAETEWPETIDAKWNRFVDTKENLIYKNVKKYISFKKSNTKPHGNGKAAKLILKKIKSLKKGDKFNIIYYFQM